jgi:hypothetical protein
MRHSLRLILSCLLVCCYHHAAQGQDPDKPEGLIRYDTAANEHFVLVRTFATLPANGRVSATISNKKQLISWQGEVEDCAKPTPGKFCRRLNTAAQIELLYRPLPTPTGADKYKVDFAIADASGSGTFRSLAISTDYKVSGLRLTNLCRGGITVDLNAMVPRSGQTGEEWQSLNSRVTSIGRWLGPLQRRLEDLADVRVEPLKSAATDIAQPKVTSIEVLPSVLKLESQRPTDEPPARISICMYFDQSLPADKFNAEVVFKGDPPFELSEKLVATLSGASLMAAPDSSAVVGGDKMALRTFENNLDVGVVFLSSVKTAGDTRKRSKTATFDIRFAPFLLTRIQPPTKQTWQRFWTPFFIDAKVSNGKIDNDTLSLNRIMFGTEYVFRYYKSAAAEERNRYLLTLRGVNASDRDYKRAEITGEFEFRPIFNVVNRPLKRSPSQFAQSVIVPDGPVREITTSKIFGYQIQPFVGTEIGRTYRDRRSILKGEELSDNVRRIYFGADMAFDLTSHFTLSFTDMLYVRGEAPEDRLHHYFNGKIEVPLGSLWTRLGQSVYLSFERGGQPPFSTPNVNALKVGYRIRSNFFELGTSR